MTKPRLVPTKNLNRLTHAQDAALTMAAGHKFAADSIARLAAISFARYGRNGQVRALEAENPDRAREGIRWADDWLAAALMTAQQTQMAPQSARKGSSAPDNG